MLAVVQREVTGKMVAEQARTYCGVPILEGGRDRNGIDCIGLVLAVARDLGLHCPQDFTNYGLNIWRHPKDHVARKALREFMAQTHPNDASFSEVLASARVGDVVLFAGAGIAISLAIVTSVEKVDEREAAGPHNVFRAHIAALLTSFTGNYDIEGYEALSPVKKLVGGLHELGDTFEEYDFSLKWGCAINSCYRYRVR